MELSTTMLCMFVILLDWLLTPIFYLKEKLTRKVKLPPVEGKILRTSATQLADLIRKRKVSCQEVVKTYIARIRQVEPIINAVVEDRFRDALEDAKSVDKFLSDTLMTEEELKRKHPLLGVPVTVKESCTIKGLSCSVGCWICRGTKADEDCEAVTKLKAAGSIPLLVSNTPELCSAWDCTNYVTGTTSNPYNTAYSVAGSSGGEGALIASAASVIGIGSDLAGSIRLPALFNGIYGFKPTSRVTSAKGHCPFTDGNEDFVNFLTIGPLVRYAEDLALMMTVLSEDPSSLKLDEKVNFSHLRFYSVKSVSDSWLYPSTDEEIQCVIDKSVKHFEDVHHSKRCSKKFSGLKEMFEMGLTLVIESINDVPVSKRNQNNDEEDSKPWWEVFKSLLLMSELTFCGAIVQLFKTNNVLVPKNKCGEFRKKVEEMKNEMVKELGSDGILLLPTYPSSAFQKGRSLMKVRGFLYLMAFNLLGFPALNVPTGLNRNGLPIGLQVVAAPHQDRLCMAVGKELERRFGGWVEPS